jgi:hypothetical protein
LLLAGEVEGLTREAVELALAGDPAALRLCLERIVGPYRERAVEFTMPPIWRVRWPRSPTRWRRVRSPREAMQLGHVVEAYVRAVEATEFERRLRALETADIPPA